MVSDFVAIDPLALIFPSSVYQRLVEKFHPNEPPTAHLAEVVKQLTPQEKAFVQARLRTFKEYTAAVEKVISQALAA
jgi:hypothetical protein